MTCTIVPPMRSPEPVGLSKRMTVALGLALGLVLGIRAAFCAKFLAKANVREEVAGR